MAPEETDQSMKTAGHSSGAEGAPSPSDSSANSAPASVSGEAMSRWGEARREIVATGVKLAFVTPLITTFLARDAQAAGSNHSCYPAGTECGGGTAEPCCPGTTCNPDGTSSTGSRCS
ncbi:MAG: hypothetical protein J5J06_20195 [Phycisphaerae bacterium]|nr:hypothetical protein [Phycisphaerae bacterium]